nr:TGF-beta-activated kinase 1 and MAP3K7-binding protein like [Ipomoea batatas]
MATTSRSPPPSILSPSGRNPRNLRPSTHVVIRAHSYRDQGRGKRKIVDENLQVLRGRIEDVKNREKLERCLSEGSLLGWNYDHDYKKHKKELEQSQLLQLLVVNVVGTLAFTLLTCTLCLCFISILIHISM